MTKADLQNSSMADNCHSQDSMVVSGYKSAGSAGGMASEVVLSLIVPKDCSVPGERFVQFITGLLPGASLDVGSELPVAGSNQRPTLILTDDPVMSLARQIHEGISPDKAFSGWKNSAASLLAFQRRDRQNVFLVDPGIVESPVSQALTNLISRLKKVSPQAGLVPLDSPHSQVVTEPAAPRMPNPEAIVLAAALLSDQSAERITQELRAVIFGAVEARDTQAYALAVWKNAQKSESLKILLCEQLRLEAEQRKSETEHLDSGLERLKLEAASIMKENERLRNDAILFETEKSHAKVERDRLLAEKALIEKRYVHAQIRIDALLSSHSWKITRPLRVVKGLSAFRRKNQP